MNGRKEIQTKLLGKKNDVKYKGINRLEVIERNNNNNNNKGKKVRGLKEISEGKVDVQK